MNLEFDLSIVGPALVAGVLVLSTHIPLGRRVLERGIIFIDLAIAQVAGTGVVLADSLGWEADSLGVQVIAISAALTAAVGLNFVEKAWPDIQEALIGVLFILAATASVLLVADNPHGGDNLKDILVGQILWVDYEQLIPVAIVYAALLACWLIWGDKLRALGFYLFFAVAITLSVQVVGIYLVFASLIIPALATRHLPASRQLPVAGAIGLLAYFAGISLSMWFDYPTGALIVWAMAILATLTAWTMTMPRLMGQDA